MHRLVAWTILAFSATSAEAIAAATATVFQCDFGPAQDRNYDGWPDGWTRRQGPGFPGYLHVGIVPTGGPGAKACLRIELDGFGAAVHSPAIPASSWFSYTLEGWVKTEGLVHDRAWLSLTLVDENQKPLQSFVSEKLGASQGWRKVCLGPVAATHPETYAAVIGLHLQPEGQADLTGSASFGPLRLARGPRMVLNTGSRLQVFHDPDRISVACEASGFDRGVSQIAFRLADEAGRTLAEHREPLAVSLACRDARLALPGASEGAADSSVWKGDARWKPPLDGPGFYRIEATLGPGRADAHQETLRLVVVSAENRSEGNPFGWSLPGGVKPLDWPEMLALLGQAGIGWVKCPIWLDTKAGQADQQRILWLEERLSAQGIGVVGMLAEPPAALGHGPEPSAAETFTHAQTWYPTLEPVLASLAAQVRWWQLGLDQDTSFVGYPRVEQQLAGVKKQLDRVGQDISLGIGWSWMHELPAWADAKPACRFLVMSAKPPLAAHELAAYLPVAKQGPAQCWVALEPLSAARYGLEVRAVDLIQRMVAARIHGADMVFVPEPFSNDHGLMRDDGTPGELFLPWRTTALMLAGAEPLGSIQWPQGSQNQVFARDGQAVLVVWNRQPCEEVLYLGEQVRHVDPWGRIRTPEQHPRGQLLRVGPVPSFVTGVDLAVTRFRQDCRLASARVATIYGQPQPNELVAKNHFGRGAAGVLTLVPPDGWKIEPARCAFKLAPGEPLRHAFAITLPYSATSSRQVLRIDCDVEADRSYRFSVYQPLEVGLGDVVIDVLTRLNAQGELEVEEHLLNRSDAPVSFRCELFAPNRQRLKTDVLNQGQGRDIKMYRLPDGRELIGQTLWLRLEEIKGHRVLNYRFLAQP